MIDHETSGTRANLVKEEEQEPGKRSTIVSKEFIFVFLQFCQTFGM